MLSLSKLVKQFDGVFAVNGVSFTVQKGNVYGFLGPNGAGKTTTIRMIMGIIQPDQGEIQLNGESINQLSRNYLGYLPEDRGLYQKQRLEETIVYFGMLRGLNKSDAISTAKSWLSRFSLGNQGNRKIEELSKGNQQKIQFILSLIHDPELLILDEPFTGLDPINQLLLKEIIQEKQDEGKTIVFSTHQMEQVERLCTNICLVNKGEVVLEGALNSIRRDHASNAVDVRFQGDLKTEEITKYFTDYSLTDHTISGVLTCESTMFLNWLNNHVIVESFQLNAPSLEQIFIERVRADS